MRVENLKPCQKCGANTSHTFEAVPFCPPCYMEYKKVKRKVDFLGFLKMNWNDIKMLSYREPRAPKIQVNKKQKNLF